MNYPLPRNHFRVEWGGIRIGFCEVSGLGVELEAPSFRDGASPENSNLGMPGILRYPHLVLKRTLVQGDNDFYKWFQTVKFNTVERRDITVSLLDAQHQPVVIWKFKNAFPVKLEYSPLDAQCSGPMFESLEIAHEGLSVENS